MGQEDPLEEGMATHPSIPAWRIPWTEESGGLWSTESQSIRHNEQFSVHTSIVQVQSQQLVVSRVKLLQESAGYIVYSSRISG